MLVVLSVYTDLPGDRRASQLPPGRALATLAALASTVFTI
jgi:hypothetical protein